MFPSCQPVHVTMVLKHTDNGFLSESGGCWTCICKTILKMGVARSSRFGLTQLLPPALDSGSWPIYESCSLCGSWLSDLNWTVHEAWQAEQVCSFKALRYTYIDNDYQTGAAKTRCCLFFPFLFLFLFLSFPFLSFPFLSFPFLFFSFLFLFLFFSFLFFSFLSGITHS